MQGSSSAHETRGNAYVSGNDAVMLWALVVAAGRSDAFASCAAARKFYDADALTEETRMLRAGRANVSHPLAFVHVPRARRSIACCWVGEALCKP